MLDIWKGVRAGQHEWWLYVFLCGEEISTIKILASYRSFLSFHVGHLLFHHVTPDLWEWFMCIALEGSEIINEPRFLNQNVEHGKENWC